MYGPVRAACPLRVLACLVEMGVEFELIHVDLDSGEHKKPDFLLRQVRLLAGQCKKASKYEKLFSVVGLVLIALEFIYLNIRVIICDLIKIFDHIFDFNY